jgi:hypothetical protein
MARLGTLFGFQWKMYLRCLEANSSRRTERMIASWIGFVIFLRYTVNTVFIANTLASGDSAFGMKMIELNLLYVGIILVMAPFLLRTVLATGASLNTQRLLLASIGHGRLFVLKIAETIFRPSFAIMFLGSLFSVALLAFSHTPAPGVIFGFLYIVFCISLSLFLATIGTDFTENRAAKGISSIILVVFALLLLGANYNFSMQNDSLYSWIGSSKVLLWNRINGTGLLSVLSSFAPSSWVVSIASGNLEIERLCFFIVVPPALIVLSFVFYRLSIGRQFQKKKHRAEIKFDIPRLRVLDNRTGVIFVKHIERILREPVYFVGTILLLVSGALMFAKDENSRMVSILLLIIAFIVEGRLFFNMLGYDAFSLDRYRLAPLSGLVLLRARNAALFSCLVIQYFPFLVMGVVSSGVLFPVLMLLGSCIIWVLYTIWGNLSSLVFITPVMKRDGASLGTSDRFINMCMSMLPFLAIYLLRGLLSSASVYILLPAASIILALCIACYLCLLRRQGAYLESKLESVTAELFAL